MANLIVRLWTHRRDLPVEQPILGALDSVENAISRLQPGRPDWSYFGLFENIDPPGDAETQTSAALKAALVLDKLAGDVVHALIGYGAAQAEIEDGDWVVHAKAIGDRTLRRTRTLRTRTEDDADESNPLKEWTVSLAQRVAALSKLLDSLRRALEDGDLPAPGNPAS